MIECLWKTRNTMLINIDGQVYPCCYLANQNTMRGANQELMNIYNDNRDDLNVFNKTIDEINNHQWWELLEESWQDSDKTLRQCKRWCTVKE